MNVFRGKVHRTVLSLATVLLGIAAPVAQTQTQSDDLRWFVPYYADVGGGNSKFTWQAIVGVGYSFGWGDLIAAWRYLDYEFKSGEPPQTMTFNGVAVGASFRC